MDTIEMLRRYLDGDNSIVMSIAHVNQVIAELERLRAEVETLKGRAANENTD